MYFFRFFYGNKHTKIPLLILSFLPIPFLNIVNSLLSAHTRAIADMLAINFKRYIFWARNWLTFHFPQQTLFCSAWIPDHVIEARRRTVPQMRLQGNSSVDWRLLVPPIYPEMEEGGGRKQAGEQHISLGQRQENRTHAVAATHHWPQEDFAVFTWRGKSCLVFWSQLRKDGKICLIVC